MSGRSRGRRKRAPADNVLIDLGFEDAEAISARATLALKLNQLIDERGLSQAEASRLLGMPQPKISAVRNYKLQGISLERLMHALTALGQNVRISVTPGTKRSARISVAA
jgi:predicted XRE-type DNA-binding protein